LNFDFVYAFDFDFEVDRYRILTPLRLPRSRLRRVRTLPMITDPFDVKVEKSQNFANDY
jgi:hypothetical protein